MTDPSPVSTFGDVCYEVSLRELELQFRGGLSCEDGSTLFSEGGEAEAEARSRLLTRDAAKALGAGAQALKGAATVPSVGEDGEVVFSAPIPESRR